jgi:UDP-N-acetylglucosamine--N-acetylmuramyl-(pentapeptide) pyrophosphoryl-undecaprenol N-acetylglucosamine transferase
MDGQPTYRIVLTGGGSGGHVMPLVAVAEKLREKLGSEVEFLYVGSKGKIERSAMEGAGIPVKFVMTGKLRRYWSLRNFLDAFRVPLGFLQALWHLLWYMPDAVFSKGGFVAVPVVLAAWVYRIPVLTQDSDAVPGMATRILGKFADRVAVAYPSAKQYFLADRVVLTGNPIRTEITRGSLEDARRRFGLDPEKPTVFVLGGSLGALAIDRAVVRILPKLLQRAQVIHQTGEAHYRDTVARAEELGIRPGEGGYRPFPFLGLDELRDAFAAADLMVSRAGANAIAEIAAVGKPAILVPLATAANDEQRMNAYEIARIGGALVLEEGNLGENMLLDKIGGLLDDHGLSARMGEAVRAFHRPDAADLIAEGIIGLIRD